MIITQKEVKNLICKENGRSSDFTTPSFIFGCCFNCFYCYLKRHNPDTVQIASNLDKMLSSIDWQSNSYSFPKKPNQCDSVYYVHDIGCNVDISLHWKHLDWIKVFDFYKNHNKLKATFATKFVNKDMKNYNPNRKVRIRFSLTPEDIRHILEPSTSDFKSKVDAINTFYDAGYEVHINWSPVIYREGWIDHYIEMFNHVNNIVREDVKKQCFAEVIFLTHNKGQHEKNLANGFTVQENLLWQEELQESKKSIYGGDNIRYERTLKERLIKEFKKHHEKIIPWNKIRYIF